VANETIVTVNWSAEGPDGMELNQRASFRWREDGIGELYTEGGTDGRVTYLVMPEAVCKLIGQWLYHWRRP